MLKRFSVAENIYGIAVPESTISSARNVRNATSFGNLTDSGGTIDYRDNAVVYIDKNGKVKRNKSFWRFSKSEEILEGMAMWRHRDLIPSEQEQYTEDQVRETTLKRNSNNKKQKKNVKNNMNFEKRSATLERSINIPVVEKSHKYQLTKNEIDHRISRQNEMQMNDNGSKTLEKQGPPPKPERTSSDNKSRVMNKKVSGQHDREEDIYGDQSTLQRRTPLVNADIQEAYSDTYDDRSIKKEHKNMWNGNEIKDYFDHPDANLMDDFDQADMSFYDDDSMQEVTMKSIKRRDILKQYYSSGTDTERNSTSSDPYDCIVVEDHLVSAAELARKNKKNRKSEDKPEFSTFRSNKTEASRIEQQQTRNSGSLLPRTKLSKTSGHKSDSQSKYESGHESSQDTITKKRSNKSNSKQQHPSSQYSGWMDLWNESKIQK